MALSWTLDKIGVLARSAECCGYVLNDIAGADDDDPASARKSFYFAPQFARRTPDLRFGFASTDFNEMLDEQYRPVFAKALEVIRSLGARMIEMQTPELPYGPAISTIIDSEAASIFENLIRSGQVDQLADPHQINGLKASLNYSAVDYLKAMRIRRQVMQSFRDHFKQVDVLVAPTRNTIADRADIPFDEQRPRPPAGSPPAGTGAGNAPPQRPRGVYAGLIPASNLAGLPALSLPCGFVNGLPVAIQLIGPAFSESMLLHIGQEFQKLTDFHRQRPPVG
jgi:aspartyl-tRNA(Asn)/glutamyl-tRNA(Gln) amidotransferase subunit A